MKTIQTNRIAATNPLVITDFFVRRIRTAISIFFVFFLLLVSSTVAAQLGVYAFTGAKNCPTQNPVVTSQPANALFSNFSTVNTKCKDEDNICIHEEWNTSTTINLNEYHQFSITANANYSLILTSLTFTQFIKDEDAGTTRWILRSSIDNYATNIATGSALEATQNPTITLPASGFTGISSVTFRIYIIDSKDNSNEWTIDNVALYGSAVLAPNVPPNPTSDAPQCSNPGVTLSATGLPPAGETWYWQTTANGTSTANSGSTYVVSASGTYYIRSQDNATLAWSNGAGNITIAVTPNVSTPVFASGASSTRCDVAGNITYTATAANSTGITYSLDAASMVAGNSIDALTGEVTYIAGWTGTSIITANATGCNGPAAATHTVTVSSPVTAPVFALGASSSRCQGAGTVVYTASATNTTGITYTLDAASLAGGNSISSSTGAVTYLAGWNGTTTVTASAAGCNGPQTSTHTITINPTVGTPVFALGSSSYRCAGAASINYSATAIGSTAITYSLDALSSLTGSSINSATGTVNFSLLTVGNSTITATATGGCGGPRTATHVVSIHSPVGTPTFTLGATSNRCEGAGTVTYTAAATNTSGITYSLDAASIAGGNSINSSTGAVTYIAGWIGTTTITASAAGCNGPRTASHTVTISVPVTNPVFVMGTSSTRCQGAEAITYSANESNGASVTYSLSATSIAGGNTINSSTGEVTYSAGFSGTSVITASAAGCNGVRNSTHTVTVTATVGLPVFTSGVSSSRCQGAGTITYTANATNTTGITYSLDATSIAAGNSIDPATGEVVYNAAWSGVSTITASADGCNGPRTRIHTVTTNPTVGTPEFTLGTTSVRCQRAGPVSYSATAIGATGFTYGLDAASLAGGNIINTGNGTVTYVAGWTGTSIITATAAGCDGPQSSTHTVTTTPVVTTPVFALGTSSTRCEGAEIVAYTASANNTTGITYSLNAAAIAAGNTIDAITGELTFTATWTGIATITATADGCTPRSANHTVTTTASVGAPVFTLGANSTRCQRAQSTTYTASAANDTGLSFSLDAASIAGGNTINPATGAVAYSGSWNGVSTITATATGCNGPVSSTHTVTITPIVGTPVFTLGTTSSRCQGPGSIIYDAVSTDATGITYSLNGGSLAGGNTINSATGEVTYAPGYTGTSTVTASATGCSGPRISTHTVTVTPIVGLPIFVSGLNSTRCQGASTVTYTANATNTTGITYSLDAASLSAGNSIIAATGAVTYVSGWSGTSAITADAAGCNGPRTATHTVTITPSVSTPVFTSGATSTRCQGAGTVTYSATAANSTGITYGLDATTDAYPGNSINISTGNVTYAAGWSGTSTITANAAGCNGPATATHTVTTTATVGTPVFSLGAVSTRCQGAGTITYTANATNNTGITYSLDAASIAGGNSINTSTGTITYAAGWFGTSTITASATGCNGPTTSTHIVTTTGTVGSPFFTLGSVSTRLQGAGTVTYTANANYTSGITYSLDAASIAGGNTINSSTGTVTYNAGWGNATIITATAAGCGGPKTATHTVSVNSAIVTKQLYLSDPAQVLDRVDPVNTGDATTANSALLSSTGTTFTTFSMAPVLCSDLTIKAGAISVINYITLSSGVMPANPSITAELRYGATNIITLTNPIYNSGILTWTATLGADVTVPAGQAIALQVTTTQPGVIFRIDFDSQTKPSKINLPVSTYLDVTALAVYSAPYPGGLPVTSGVGGTVKYIRATVTDPFGASDITGMNITITPTGSTVAAVSVGTSGCTRTYEYAWTTPAVSGSYAIAAIGREGFENTVTNTENTTYAICATCAPVAVNDNAAGAGGTPTVADVLANDYDPNNNINNASLAIVTGPNNGSAYIANNTIVYLPNGAFAGKDTITYRICDLTSPTPLCATAQIFLTIDPLIVDICGDATKTHTYYIPYPADQSYIALEASGSPANPSNNVRTVISVKIPYPGMTLVWDEWEDGYEVNALNPTQATTKVWGDGNPFNGIAPGYPSDVIPAGGSLSILDNTMNSNPRNPAEIFYDGKDKVVSSGQIAMTQVAGEPSIMSVQSIKTNITSTYDFGQSFTIPLGEDFPSRDFRYTALFIRASQNNTTINIDKDNNGTFETTATLNEGGSFLVDGGVLTGATVTSDKPVGVELNAGGVDNYSIRNAPIYPATWYSNTYYSPVPTSDNPADNPKDSSVVMFYNSLNRAININWYSGAPANGVIAVPAKSAVRFPLAYSATSAYKFVNLTGESFTAIEIVNSYAPGGTGTVGQSYDWSFNLISEARLTDYTTVAWAPGGLDLVAPVGPDVNGNPVWVTPTANTIVYVKYDGNISGTSGLVSPCGLRYDVSYTVNALNYIKIKDPNDNDQGGIAIYTCNGAKIAAAYGEDPQGSTAGNTAYWDVGSTIQPFCKQKIVIATDDYATTLVSQPVTISVLLNDFGFLGTIDPTTVTTLGLMQPKHGTVSVNDNGTILYIPDPGYAGVDTFEYRVCSTPSPIVCDAAMVVVRISSCPSNGNQNVISGQLFIDRNKDAVNNDGGIGLAGIKVYLYTDGNCNATINPNELSDSVIVDSSGFYQFTKSPEKNVEDNFDDGSGGRTCNNGTDGDSPWSGNWVDANDLSAGFCNNSQIAAFTDVDIFKDGSFSYALRLKDNNVSATRSVNLNNATKAFLTFAYRRKSATLTSGEDVLVQASSNGSAFTTIYTIAGDGGTDANYVTIYNQDITAYASATSAIRFLTNGSVDDADTVYIDDVSVKFLKYPQCYITSVNAASIPANYTLTTAGQKTMTINNGGTCTSHFDFGFGKANVIVSGTLRNDKNGLKDGLVNGTAVGVPDGAAVYAYLADVTGNVALKTTVNSSNGTYSFPLAEIQTNYTLVLSVTDVVLGAAPPASFGSSWIAVGESYGLNNSAGAGNEPGTPNGAIAVNTGMLNVTNVDIGIERLPNSDNHTRSINQPAVNQFLVLNGQGMNPPILSGADPEDCVSGCIITTRSVIIDTVPVNSELYYNSTLVTNGQLINNFNPDSLKLKVTAAAMGYISISFRYSYVDDAIIKDPTPATYTLIWLVPLPSEGLTASATLHDDNNVDIKWSTLSEQNTSYFEVERSLDNVNFEPTAHQVQASGNSDKRKEYKMDDKLPGQVKSDVVYYRVKLVDQDGKVTYSNVTAVRISKKPGVTVWPNPFQEYVTISITTVKEAIIDVNLIDVNGKVLRKSSQSVPRGISQITIRDLSQLPSGVYLVEITDKTAGTTFQKLLKNN